VASRERGPGKQRGGKKMKACLKLFLTAVMVFYMSGCFDFNIYESGVPMAPVKHAVFDPQLVGEWESMDTEEGNTEYQHLRFIRFNQKEYAVASPQKDGCSIVRAYIVRIKGVPFLNLQELETDGEQNFVYCKYTLSPDGELTLTFVGDELFADLKDKLTRPKKLYKFIKKNLSNKKLLNTESTMKFQRQ
jgi:hypothetical protein